MSKAAITKLPEPLLIQTVFQVRYDLELGVLRRLLQTAEAFRGYPDFQVPGAFQVLLVDAERRCSLSIGADACGYDQMTDDAQLESDRTEEMLDRLQDGLAVRDYVRIGYRRLYTVPVAASLEDLLSLMRVKLMSSSTGLWKALPAIADHVSLRVQGRDEALRYTVSIASFSRPQLTMTAPAAGGVMFPVPDYLAARLPDMGLMFDIDAFQDLQPTPASAARGIVNSARSHISNMTTDLVRHLFATELE